jgi:hypothetical protein
MIRIFDVALYEVEETTGCSHVLDAENTDKLRLFAGSAPHT